MTKNLKKVYLCELVSKEDGARSSVVAFRSERSAKRWRELMQREDANGFSSEDRAGCFAVIKMLEVRP